MKKQNFILITHILLQFILFMPIAPFIKYQQTLDMGIIIVFLLSIMNFIAYVVCVLNSEKDYIVIHSLIVELFIIFTFLEDLILRELLIGKHIELLIYSLIVFAIFNLTRPSNKIKYILSITTLGLFMSIVLMKLNVSLSSLLFNWVVIILMLTPSILFILDRQIQKYESSLVIVLQILYITSFIIYKKYENIGLVSISEYQLFTCIFIESALLYRISKSKIKNGLIYFSNSLRKIFPEFIILFTMLYLTAFSF